MKKSNIERKPTEEIDLLDSMLSSLVEILEEKGIITQEECEKKIKEKVKIQQAKILEKIRNSFLRQKLALPMLLLYPLSLWKHHVC